jgi:hypothetical protein
MLKLFQGWAKQPLFTATGVGKILLRNYDEEMMMP